MERRALTFGRFAVPAAIFELLAQELIGKRLVRLFEMKMGAEIRSDPEDSTLMQGSVSP
jgi:hypothetical protein